MIMFLLFPLYDNVFSVFRIRIRLDPLLDPDPHGQMQIRIQEMTSSEIKQKIGALFKNEKKRKFKN